jgi:hypothetical protein
MIMLSQSCRVGEGLHSWNRYRIPREGTVSARKPTMLGSCELAGMTLALILASLVLSQLIVAVSR